MPDRTPGHGRYAYPEREQRWVAAGVPSDARVLASISDRYIHGTRLRLRRTENARGVVVYKLGQKVRLEPGNPETVRLTNMYLSAEEYEALLALPAAEVQKERWTSTWAERQIAVDRFFGRLDGLVLAEVELEPSEAYAPSPPYATRDVTQDDRFSGGALAFASDIEIDLLLKDLTTAGRDVKPPPTSDYRGDHRL